MREREIFVVSDTHFGHSNIIKYQNRPFANTEQMDKTMLENWNDTVREQDIIYHLGDVYFDGGLEYPFEFLKQLKGRKRLLLGNHDEAKDQVLHSVFEKIMLWRMFPEYRLLLTHLPMHMDEDPPAFTKYDINVHGHIHGNPAPTPKHINVSVELTDYTPVNILALVGGIK